MYVYVCKVSVQTQWYLALGWFLILRFYYAMDVYPALAAILCVPQELQRPTAVSPRPQPEPKAEETDPMQELTGHTEIQQTNT